MAPEIARGIVPQMVPAQRGAPPPRHRPHLRKSFGNSHVCNLASDTNPRAIADANDASSPARTLVFRGEEGGHGEEHSRHHRARGRPRIAGSDPVVSWPLREARQAS